MAANFVNVSSPEQFKEELSKDLNRVSLLNFWAPWAEPCAAFNKAVEEAATRYPSVLFLNVSERGDACASWLTRRSRPRSRPILLSHSTLRLFPALWSFA